MDRREEVTDGPTRRLRLGILSDPESWYANELITAATAREHRPEVCDFRMLSDAIGFSSSDSVRTTHPWRDRFDAVIVRTMPAGSLEQVVFRMDCLLALQSAGVFVLNPPKAMECAIDKYLTTVRLANAGVPVPETIVCESETATEEAFARLGSDVVLKPIFGSEGRGVMRITDPELFRRAIKTLVRLESVLYLQRFVPHPGFDLRIVLLGDEVLGAMRRHATDGFRTNVSQRGVAEAVTPTDAEVMLARKAMTATGCVFAGVDLLTDSVTGRTYVLEVNAVPGWRSFQRVTDVPVGGRVIEFLERVVPQA